MLLGDATLVFRFTGRRGLLGGL